MSDEANGWIQYKLLVIDRLERLEKAITDLTTSVNNINTDVTAIKIKSGLWGAIAGSVPALITMLIYFVIKK